jgi:BirA family transcriptional regulator, biotin operon repressor / biotin---[acetyl-CoA-carboxylase] ligase
LHKIQPKTLFFGKNIIYLPTCQSTNDEASQLVRQSAVHEGLVVITDNQTAGRGQRGNNWQTNAGQNFTLSVVLQPHFLTAVEQFKLNIAISVGVFDFLEPYLGTTLKIKWPNDIYVENKKLGGILIENTIQNSRIETSIVGIGLNINQLNFPNIHATSLGRFTGQFYNLDYLLAELLENLEKNYLSLRNNGFNNLKVKYLRNMFRYQETHWFEENGERFRGTIMGIDEHGRLAVETQHLAGTSQVEPQNVVTLRYFDFKEISFVI